MQRRSSSRGRWTLENFKLGPVTRYKWSYGAPISNVITPDTFTGLMAYITPFITIVGAHLVLGMLGAVRSWRPWQVHQPPPKASRFVLETRLVSLAVFWKAHMTKKLLCGWALSDNCGAASLRWLRSCVCKLHIMGLAPCHLNFPVKRQNGETRSVRLPKSMSSQNSQMSTFGWSNSAERKPAFTNWSLHRVGWRLNLNILFGPLLTRPLNGFQLIRCWSVLAEWNQALY